MKRIEISNSNEEDLKSCNDHELVTIDNCDLSYDEFFKNVMINNSPCLIKNVTLKWECTKKWIRNDTINFDCFIEEYGDLVAPVADCNSFTYNAQDKMNMKVNDFINYMKQEKKDKLLYLKDWHLKRLRPEDSFYEIPLIFSSDWLNEFATDHNEDDFMFVYMGPEHSWTPFHADVYCSYSWSVNVVGKKQWLLFPPGEENKIKDPLGNYPVLYDSIKYPDIRYLEVIQEAGDALFVPSGWYHQVINLLDTISINHNWINGCNIETVWNAIEKNLLLVENEIKELHNTPEFVSQCQLILKSVFGMDFFMFVNFISYIGRKRLTQLEQENQTNCELGINHIMFDLRQVLKIMNLVENHHLFIKISTLDFIDTKKTLSVLFNS